MLLLLSLLGIPQVTPSVDPLARSFLNPPASSRPHTWWHWMDGNISREGITADLEAMKSVGIGGAHIFDVGQGVPSGPVAYNSQEWQDLMVFALREAKRLGLEMTIHNCSGWSSSGAPWVQPKDAMKKVVFTTTQHSGFGQANLAKPEANRGFYQDIALLAFPRVENTSGARNELVGLGANPGKVPDVSWPKIDPKTVLQIPLDKLRDDGTLDYQFPPGNWTVLRIGTTLTGALNVASRQSGLGLEVDKLSAESLDRFLDGGVNPLLDKVGQSSSLTTVLIDSYETGYNNWTPKMLEEFKTRRGYDALPYLPTLAGYSINNSKETLGFLFDYRRTIAELWAENYSGHFAKRLQDRKLQLAIEPYGNGNFDPFAFGKPAGLIMGEYWVGDFVINPSVKQSASVAHVYGHQVVGAEALTAMPNQAGWRNQPKQWKPFADHAMTLGINRIIYHRFAHQPWAETVLPGMTMGPWGSHVDRGNTIWPYMPAWNEYLSRAQFMLQSGTFVGDILVYTGEDSPQTYAGEGQELPEVPTGYDFDLIGMDPLLSLAVKNGKLSLPNGASYEVLALPPGQRMTLPVIEKLRKLVEAGATIVGPKPTQNPSQAEMLQGKGRSLLVHADALWGTSNTPRGSRRVKLGEVHWGRSIEEVLRLKQITPAFTAKSGGVRTIQRRIGNALSYFVATSRPYPQTELCRFRAPSPNVKVQLWHPESGKIEDAPVWKYVDRSIELPLTLGPEGSVFVMIVPGQSSKPHLTSLTEQRLVAETKPEPVLKILKAVYGDEASGKVKDVTSLVVREATAHNLRLQASNGALGGDPALNIVKHLTLTYQLGDETKTVVIRENDMVSIGNLPDAGTPPVYQIQNGVLSAWQNATFAQTWSNGSRKTLNVNNVPAPVEIKGPWQASFPAGWDAPSSVSFDKLTSWTEHPDFGVKHFSGTVTYRNDFKLTNGQLGNDTKLYLDLGDVREMCKVRINGDTVATLWKAPYRMDITSYAVAGQNTLEVEVTNLWVNRLIGDEQFPDDMGWNGAQLSKWPDWFVNKTPRPEPRRKTFTTWRHNMKDTPLMPSGLLGPVMLRTVKQIPLNP